MYTLEKEIRKGLVIFKVVDVWSLKVKDFFLFSKEGEMPILEKYFFDAIRMLLESNKDKPYTRKEFNLWLETTYNFGISESGRRLEIENSFIIFPIYKKLKYETFNTELFFLSKKFTKAGIENCKKKIELFKYDKLDKNTKELIKKGLSLLPKDTKPVDLFNELKKLIYLEAEKNAITNARRFQHQKLELIKKYELLTSQE